MTICTRPVFLLGFVVFWLLMAIPSAVAVWKISHSEPRLVPSAAVIDLGTIPQGGFREAQFSLTNPGDEALEITAIETGCPCLEIELAKKRILPGETIPALARFDGRREPDFVGRLRMEARGRSRDGWVLLAVVEADVLP